MTTISNDDARLHVLAVLPLSLLDTPDLFYSLYDILFFYREAAAAQSGLCRLYTLYKTR